MAATAGAATAVVAATADPVERISRLANGLTIATDRVPEARSVAMGVWVAVGSRDEPGHLAGVSHFLEHLLFKGTARRAAHEIAEEVESVGGDMNAFTAQELTAYYVRVPDQRLALAVDNFNPANPFNAARPPRELSDSAHVLYHGGFAGFEWMW